MTLSDLVIPPWVKLGLRLLPFLVIAGLSVALFATRATLRDVRSNDKLLAAQTQLHTKDQELQWTQKLSAAQSDYSQSLVDLSKVKSKSDEDTKAFAATPAGAVPCLALDRVRALTENRAALEAALAPAGGPNSLPAPGDTSPRP